jgi:DNA replication protein DnaC
VECKNCKDTGYIYNKENNSVKECNCLKVRILKEKYERSGISKVFEKHNFFNFDTDKKPEIIKAAKQICMGFVKSYSGKQSLMLLGQVGIGKTHLCMAIANNLLAKNIAVLYMDYRDAITELKQLLRNGEGEYYYRALNRYKDAQLLYIDDLYKGATSRGVQNESDIRIMFEIINHRYKMGLPILVSSELDSKKLLEYDEGIGSRIFEMCNGFKIEFPYKLEFNHRLKINN